MTDRGAIPHTSPPPRLNAIAQSPPPSHPNSITQCRGTSLRDPLAIQPEAQQRAADLRRPPGPPRRPPRRLRPQRPLPRRCAPRGGKLRIPGGGGGVETGGVQNSQSKSWRKNRPISTTFFKDFARFSRFSSRISQVIQNLCKLHDPIFSPCFAPEKSDHFPFQWIALLVSHT